MNAVRDHGARPRGGKAKPLWAVAGLMAILATAAGCAKGSASEDLGRLAKGGMAKLVPAKTPIAEPGAALDGPDGKPVHLADFKGQVVVANLWASWCAPCVKEMPTLAQLQKAYAGKPLKVLPISLDKGDQDLAKAKAFIADKAPLQFYHAPYSLAFSLSPPVEGLPTTVIYDKNGIERARLAGGADWSTGEARAVMDRLLAARD